MISRPFKYIAFQYTISLDLHYSTMHFHIKSIGKDIITNENCHYLFSKWRGKCEWNNRALFHKGLQLIIRSISVVAQWKNMYLRKLVINCNPLWIWAQITWWQAAITDNTGCCRRMEWARNALQGVGWLLHLKTISNSSWGTSVNSMSGKQNWTFSEFRTIANPSGNDSNNIRNLYCTIPILIYSTTHYNITYALLPQL